MKKLVTIAVLVIVAVTMLSSCASSRKYGCPGQAMLYGGR
jgi:hypothetical protein